VTEETPGGSEILRHQPRDRDFEPAVGDAELVMALPAEWPLEQSELEDESNYWPLGLLKMLARLPHEFETFVWFGHTIPNGDPPALRLG
jgi:hypothetical protein